MVLKRLEYDGRSQEGVLVYFKYNIATGLVALASCLVLILWPPQSFAATALDGYDCAKPRKDKAERYLRVNNGQLKEWIAYLIIMDGRWTPSCIEQRQPSILTLDRDAALSLLRPPSSQEMQYSSTTGVVGILATHFGASDTVTCAGILLSPTIVMTARHCIYDTERGGQAASGEFQPADRARGAERDPLLVAPGGFIVPPWSNTSGSSDQDRDSNIAFARLLAPVLAPTTYLPLRISDSFNPEQCCDSIGLRALFSGGASSGYTYDVFPIAPVDSPVPGTLEIPGADDRLMVGAPIFQGMAVGETEPTKAVMGVVTDVIKSRGVFLRPIDAYFISRILNGYPAPNLSQVMAYSSRIKARAMICELDFVRRGFPAC